MDKKIIPGKSISKKILKTLEKRVRKLKSKNITPKMAVILVSDNKASASYVKHKEIAAKKIGVNFTLYHFKEKISEKSLIKKIKKIQKEDKPNGMIAQLPLPKHINEVKILNSIDPKIDIDCLTNENLGKIISRNHKILPPTPDAILSAIKYTKIDLKGKNIVIIGSGLLVGRPLSVILSNMKATVTLCNSSTKNLKKKCLSADIIISGVGKKHIITKDMVKKDAIVIDAGVSFHKNKMYGDVDIENVIKKAKFISPTPNGIGPITIAKLLENLLILTK
ncbi:MAG: bifunctional 5,10-methylenetetrahydrofolate dehydrogenase/5,10-methenyltetrahydrofolate cyclohydrolase [Candidatus Magasanikbacteria bacterium]|nr:bifunctional 5,10-methylenetetrahydrofolate dehydrogenase/5,10-methenyltetrahydrofolate cyclohydrolase [Candidatus Magasanikbacteria bacterium]